MDSDSEIMLNYQSELINHKPFHNFFIGIDSDGCVFDSMEVKQKKFFIPLAIEHFGLQGIADTLRETWEFVNLYSIHRGGNRFISLVKVFELLSERKEIKNSGVLLPDVTALKKWIGSETKLGNATLAKYCETHTDNDLLRILKWSETINIEIAERLPKIPPFHHALNAIVSMSENADLIIVSQTPLEALVREWEDHDLKKYARLIAGQEHGSKSEHLALAAREKYDENKILMIGDAVGDLKAAENNGTLFFPIIPGKEDESWKTFLNQGLNKFKEGRFRGSYQVNLISQFLKSLPEKPLWK
jgi:HAD superfamily hydrolase (TIGR01549 family)